MKAVLTAAAAIAFFAAPAFAQTSSSDASPDVVPGAETNDSDADDAVGADGTTGTIGTTTTGTGATVTTTNPSVDNAGQSDVVPGVDNNSSDVIIEGQNDAETETGIVAAPSTSGAAAGAGTGAVDGGSVGVTASDTDAGEESNTPSAGVVPGQDPE